MILYSRHSSRRVGVYMPSQGALFLRQDKKSRSRQTGPAGASAARRPGRRTRGRSRHRRRYRCPAPCRSGPGHGRRSFYDVPGRRRWGRHDDGEGFFLWVGFQLPPAGTAPARRGQLAEVFVAGYHFSQIVQSVQFPTFWKTLPK